MRKYKVEVDQSNKGIARLEYDKEYGLDPLIVGSECYQFRKKRFYVGSLSSEEGISEEELTNEHRLDAPKRMSRQSRYNMFAKQHPFRAKCTSKSFII